MVKTNNHRLGGRADAASLLGIAGGALSSLPQFMGTPELALAAGGAALLGGAGLTWPRVRNAIDSVDMDVKEGWVMASDEVIYAKDPLREIIVGYTTDKGLPVAVPNSKQPYHSAIFGASGYGKSVLAITQILQQTMQPRSGGWIMIDAKLDFKMLAQLHHIAKMAGREDEFYVLNIMDPSLGHTYNPILAGEGHEVASRIMALTPDAAAAPATAYYRNRQYQALTAICSALKACGKNYHFGDLAVILQSPKAMAALERMTPLTSPARRALSMFLNQFRKGKKGGGTEIDLKEVQTALGGIASQVANFASTELAKSMNTYKPQINILDIILNNKMLYVMLPTLRANETAKAVAKMIMADIRSAAGMIQQMPDSARPSPPFQLFCDEFASYINPEEDSRMFEQFRSSGIAVNAFLQALSQLAQISEHHVAMLTQNTDSKYFFKHSSSDAEDAAELIGMRTNYTHNIMTTESSSESSAMLRVSPEGAEADAAGQTEGWRQAQDEYRVTPDQLRKMPIGEAVAVHGGRVYHIKTPYLSLPDSILESKPLLYNHYKTPWMNQPSLSFEDSYQDYMLDAGGPAFTKDEVDSRPRTVIEQEAQQKRAARDTRPASGNGSGTPSVDAFAQGLKSIMESIANGEANGTQNNGTTAQKCTGSSTTADPQKAMKSLATGSDELMAKSQRGAPRPDQGKPDTRGENVAETEETAKPPKDVTKPTNQYLERKRANGNGNGNGNGNSKKNGKARLETPTTPHPDAVSGKQRAKNIANMTRI